MKLGNISSSGGFRVQPERVTCFAVREEAEVVERYFEGSGGGKGGSEQLCGSAKLISGNERKEDVNVRHPARGVRIVILSNALHVRPQRLVWDETQCRFIGFDP